MFSSKRERKGWQMVVEMLKTVFKSPRLGRAMAARCPASLDESVTVLIMEECPCLGKTETPLDIVRARTVGGAERRREGESEGNGQKKKRKRE